MTGEKPFNQENFETAEKKYLSTVCKNRLYHLCDRYVVQVYPTIVFFEKGKAVERLDGIHGVGLNEGQFQEFIKVCRLQKKQ